MLGLKKNQNGKLMGIENISDRFKSWRQIMVVETLRETIKKKTKQTNQQNISVM